MIWNNPCVFVKSYLTLQHYSLAALYNTKWINIEFFNILWCLLYHFILLFLIDTGADVSVIPPSKLSKLQLQKFPLQLYAANGSEIKIFGTQLLELNLGLRRKFSWIFIVADATRPILGSDFLKHYHLPDLRNKVLVDTLVTSPAQLTNTATSTVLYS